MMLAVLIFLSATPKDQLLKAEDAYDRYDYARAVQLLDALLVDPPKSAEVRQRARLILGFAHYLARREPKAKAALRELFRENQSYVLDREMHHPDLVRFFDSEQKIYVESLVVAPAPVPKSSRPPVVSAPVTVPVNTRPLETIGDRHPWVRIFPGGIGQFANHDFVAGGLFLSIELALVGLNIGGALWRQSMRDSSGDFRQGTQPVTAQVMQNVGALGAIAVAIVGIVDAFVWSPARGRSTLTVDMGPLGDYAFKLAL